MRPSFVLPRKLPRFVSLLLGIVAATLASASAQSDNAARAGVLSTDPVVLDSVIAVINGDVLLRSDLQSEIDMAALEPLSLPAGRNLEQRAGRRIINRTLILQQMKSQGMANEVPSAEVQKDLDLLRTQLPQCIVDHCDTEAGWLKFLNQHNLNEGEVTARWQQRMQILNFIDARFRAGIRISKPEVETYYTKTLVPQFEKQNVKAPPLGSISSRIEQILLQQRVNVLLQDWLKTLRDQGSVIILDSALGKSNPSPDADDDDEGGGA